MRSNFYKILKIIIQILAISLTIFWTYTYSLLILDERALTAPIILTGIILGLMTNFGLWLTTIQFAKNHKILSTILLIPSMILNSLLPLDNIYLSIMIGILINGLAIMILFAKGEKNV